MDSQVPQYTIRGIPSEVDRILRDRARARKTSINQVIIDELTKATIGRRQHADFTDLVGRWEPDEELDERLRIQREIDANDWR